MPPPLYVICGVAFSPYATYSHVSFHAILHWHSVTDYSEPTPCTSTLASIQAWQAFSSLFFIQAQTEKGRRHRYPQDLAAFSTALSTTIYPMSVSSVWLVWHCCVAKENNPVSGFEVFLIVYRP